MFPQRILQGYCCGYITKLKFYDPYYDIEKLIDKCLIVVGEYDILTMHDLIQQMSLEIARQESKVPNKDAPEVLTRDTV